MASGERGKIYRQAVNPHQYDEAAPNWAEDGLGSSPTRLHFWEYIQPHALTWQGKDVLDIGAGTGWLSANVLGLGARSVVAIEPSPANIALARQYYPAVRRMIPTTFEEFQTTDRFDVAVALLSFVHIADIDAAFLKLSGLLRENGEVLMVVPDFEYFRKPRAGREIEIEEVSEDEYAAGVKRPHGTLYDLARTTERYAKAAAQAGMVLVEDRGLPPTEVLMQARPMYRNQAGQTMSRLIRFINP